MDCQVTIYTRVYNTEKFLPQCLDSVIGQTYRHFQHLIVDNGCTDGCTKLLQDYAAQYPWVKLIRFEKNCCVPSDLISQYANTPYFCVLDSDDWLAPRFLETLIDWMERENLDIASTGTAMHPEAGPPVMRECPRPLILRRAQYADFFPTYHAFFRAVWAKIFRSDIYIQAFTDLEGKSPPYGSDTLTCFAALRRANLIGIDSTILHHYRVHKSSASYQYNPKRFDADVFLYNDAIDFLSVYGPVSARNRAFLQTVYANAVVDTLSVIHNSALNFKDQLREYRVIASHPLTQAVYRECTDESAARSRSILLKCVIYAGAHLNEVDNTDFRAALQSLLPACGRAVTLKSFPLFLKEQSLIQSLLRDDPDSLIKELLSLISEKQNGKKYDLVGMIRALAADNPLLCQIEQTSFLRKYSEIYLMVWRGERLCALETMTGLLLENQVRGGLETFLNLYISLAALENQAPAFMFGKLQIAKLFLRQGRREKCRSAVAELIEMGLDNKELASLRRELEGQP